MGTVAWLTNFIQFLAPMLSHACQPHTTWCDFCQHRAVAAARALVAVLKYDDTSVSAAVADAFLAAPAAVSTLGFSPIHVAA